MEIKAIIFDLDGVITDTAQHHFTAWTALAKGLGIEISPENNELLKGLSRTKSLEKIFELGGKQPLSEEQMLELTDKKNKHYRTLLKDLSNGDILPGVSIFINECKQAGLPLAVGSASKNAPLILDRLGLTNAFEIIIDGNQVEQSNPDPEVFLKAAQQMNIEPNQTIVFEDAISGVEAANRGGFFSVGVGDVEHLSHANAVIPNLREFTLQQLQNLVNDTLHA